jgi:hypothetical protein
MQRRLVPAVVTVMLVWPFVVEAGAVRYRLERVNGGTGALRARFDAAQLALLEKLNRRDLEHLAGARELIVPERWDFDELAYAPLPAEWDWAVSYRTALVVDQAAQVFGAYEHGRLVRWGPVSSGDARHPTPPGLFHLNWRSTGRHSTVDADWYMPWYFNFENRRGLSMHQFVLPGRPASHACIRMLERDARWLYGWGEQWSLAPDGTIAAPGTPLLVVGTYDFHAPPPWLSPEWAERGTALPLRMP